MLSIALCLTVLASPLRSSVRHQDDSGVGKERYMPRRANRGGPEAGGLLSSDPARSSLDECDTLLATLRTASERQRSRAHFVNLSIAAGTAAIPVLLLLSTQYLSFWLGKLLPALLASLTTTAALLLQLLKPHERWRLLRLEQGVLEAERFRYVHGLAPYNETDRDELMLERVVAVATATMDEWATLQPESAGAAHLLQGGRS
jgi:uncharacterized protein DUF4231